MAYEAITHTICDRIIKWGLIFLIIFTPLAFGTVHTWSYTLMELTVILLLLIWLLKLIVTSKNPKGTSHFVRTPLNLPILLFVLLVLLQLLPLPPKAIKHLSPNTYNLYKTTLPGYDSDPQLTTDHWQLTTGAPFPSIPMQPEPSCSRSLPMSGSSSSLSTTSKPEES